ncbi:MAG: cytochrome-c peroxidase [Bacteroidota bacterium]|jgi:cytochrome c peroxidase|nr:cytochrome-c peroxidase [Cytophagales bacterium]MCE2955841.1 cytochrome-c peroxidase [Flammeovirgaceae bacterium]MCZ8072468.1 cytochrome-c peroxidase [Cytophagales bacterium]
MRTLLILSLFAFLFVSCQSDPTEVTSNEEKKIISETFGSNINLDQLPNYASQTVPGYITRNNTGGSAIVNEKALIGRVLFYDKNLSTSNTVACSSCHRQSHAFSDASIASTGVNGTTGRHSMRLVNARFAAEARFFWDERAATLEAQTTQPIQDHAEMGFSGQNGGPALADLLIKLKSKEYYQVLFRKAYNNTDITEAKLQECLAQFVRSIQSFDSKYDAGRAAAPNDGAPFANFSAQENQGKNLFLQPPQFAGGGLRTGGGAGCGGCHRAPEFDIDPNSRNNGLITKIGGGTDVAVTRAPTLRDVMRADGTLNGPLMHTGAQDVAGMINHYNSGVTAAGNTNLDPRLRPGGSVQNLQLTQAEKDALVAFLKTLSGQQVYTDARWSNPFVN